MMSQPSLAIVLGILLICPTTSFAEHNYAFDRQKDLVTKTYGVRDILVGKAITVRENSRADIGKPLHAESPESVRQARVETLLKLATGTVDPESWRDNGGQSGAIKELHGQLIATQTKENQKVIENLLAQTRKLIGTEAKEK